MFNSRVTRQNITPLYPNKYSDDILSDIIFPASALNFILSASESADAVIFNFNVLLYALMSLTEGSDTANFNYENIISAALSKTENIDTAEIDTQLFINFTFDKIENKDTAEITAQNSIPRNAELSANENSDRTLIYISRPQVQSVRRRGETYSHFVGQAWRKMSVNAVEPKDGVNINIISESDAIIFSSERTDFSGFKIGLTDSAMIKISEATDSIQNDETGFKTYMREKKLKYEQDTIIRLLMSA